MSFWACLAPSEGHLPHLSALASFMLHAFHKAQACSLRQLDSNCFMMGQHEPTT